LSAADERSQQVRILVGASAKSINMMRDKISEKLAPEAHKFADAHRAVSKKVEEVCGQEAAEVGARPSHRAALLL